MGGFEYPVPTQFLLKEKWERREPSLESRAIIQGIMERGYLNQSFPLLAPYEGARLEKYLQISAPLPGNLPPPFFLVSNLLTLPFLF